MIIPQKIDFVKLSEQKENKWQERRAQAVAMAYRICRFPSLKNRAGRMAHCSEITHSYICKVCGYPHVKSGGYCRDRLCPLCSWRLTMTKFAQMIEVLNSLTEQFQEGMYASMLTLTIRNVPIDGLRPALESITDAWRKMHYRKGMKLVRGWARNIEITHNNATHTYHPHVHILLLWQDVEEPDKAAVQIVHDWERMLGVDYKTVWHHEIAYLKDEQAAGIADEQTKAEAAAAEAAMYTLASSTLLQIPQAELEQFAGAIKGIRMTAYGGIIKDMRRALMLKEDEIEDENTDNTIETCPKCGGEMLHLIRKWNADSGCYEIVGGDI